jgi:hypothetical protein
VRDIARSVQVACQAIPFAGPAIGVILKFATHVAFAAAESAFDLADLRNGHKVKLIKSKDDWICDAEGFSERLKALAEGQELGVEKAEDHNSESGMSYEHYMIVFFLLTSDTNKLVDRTGNLIEWNVINYQSKANANNMDDKGFVKSSAAENAMKAAFKKEDCFRLKKMNTDFDITTTIDMRLLFLKMPFFQRQGSPFSNTYQIKTETYRGY